MSMYYKCFNVNVKSMGYKLEKIWNNMVIQIVTLGRVLGRCGDGSVFCFRTLSYVIGHLDQKSKLYLITAKVNSNTYQSKADNTGERPTRASCRCGDGSVLRCSPLIPATNIINQKFTLYIRLSNPVCRASTNTPHLINYILTVSVIKSKYVG